MLLFLENATKPLVLLLEPLGLRWALVPTMAWIHDARERYTCIQISHIYIVTMRCIICASVLEVVTSQP